MSISVLLFSAPTSSSCIREYPEAISWITEVIPYDRPDIHGGIYTLVGDGKSRAGIQSLNAAVNCVYQVRCEFVLFPPSS